MAHAQTCDTTRPENMCCYAALQIHDGGQTPTTWALLSSISTVNAHTHLAERKRVHVLFRNHGLDMVLELWQERILLLKQRHVHVCEEAARGGKGRGRREVKTRERRA